MAGSTDDLKLPLEFSGPAQLVLYTRYDDPRGPGWESKWIVTWDVQTLHPWFPVPEIRIHKHFKPVLHNAFTELEVLGLHTEIKSFHRGYQLINLSESPVLSVHSWGAAVDLNHEKNPKGSIGTWSDDFIRVMERHGIYAGQSWDGIKEPTHFAMVNGE